MAVHSNISHARMNNMLLMESNKLGHLFQNLGGTFTVAAGMPPLISLDPGGSSRNVVLPTESLGLQFIISNCASAAGEVLTLKASNGTTTVCTLDQNESAWVFCRTANDGTTEWIAISPVGLGDTLSIGTLTVTSSAQIGDAASDTVGFFGKTPAAQPASASQAAVTATAVTALATTAPTKTTGATYGYKTTTQAKAITARVNQAVVDIGHLTTLVDELRANLVTLGLVKGAA